MPVVLGPGWPGVLLHEAVGHGLEADFNRKKTSAFAGLIGRKVASSKVTVVDNGQMPNRRGSINVDDEGNPTQETVLIENGILSGYLSDKLSARLMGAPNTGSGRRESYQSHPHAAHDQHLHALRRRISPKTSSSPSSAASTPSISAAARWTSPTESSSSPPPRHTSSRMAASPQPVKGATLIGSGPEALKFVSMVGNDLALDEGIGTCGKDGQSVPVGVGMPTTKLDRMTVGGTG